MLQLTHSFFHNSAALQEIYLNYFTINSSVHKYITRAKTAIHLPRTKTNTGQRAVLFKPVALPEYLEEMSSRSQFKTELKRCMSTQAVYTRK